jgi:hypothetical protein
MSETKLMQPDEALALRELEQEELELLPAREEMALVNVHANGILNGSFHFNHTVNTVGVDL